MQTIGAVEHEHPALAVRAAADVDRRKRVNRLAIQKIGTRTQPSINTLALRLMMALVTVHSPSS